MQALRAKVLEKQVAFDQLFVKLQPNSIEAQDKSIDEIRECYQDLRQYQDDHSQYSSAFHNIINEHPLLASYSNIFVIVSLFTSFS